ncbi:MAG TPA: hypothetical protein VHS05_12380 [Pyrinomonadaceae bacterium]|jgi:hypothetical protein|nr:hypothetical protein [Pyrinomonadaceae bacterium]
MNLPPSLAPWSGYLNIFPDEVSVALGPIIQRVSLLIGSPHPRSDEKQGEPDGFNGLNRRGTYERLLLSEWMLADELEDEFMRRAVMGEHLFLNTARSSRAGTRASLALFDTGPSQLGSPRIAHIAALIVLANRAGSAGSSFSWGVLQQPDTAIYQDVNASNVMSLLAARSHCEVSETQIAAWEEQLEKWSGLDDVWLIGGKRLSRIPTQKRSSRLCVEDILEPGKRELIVSCISASGFSSEVTLELPENKISTRLLRDPFAASVPEIQKSGSTYNGSSLLFDMTGTKIFTRTAKWGVTTFNVPNSPRAGPGRPKSYRTHKWQSLCAAGRVGRAIALLSPEDRFVHLEYCRQGTTKLDPGYYTGYNNNVFFAPSSNDAQLTPCFSLPWDAEIAALDGAGSLFRFSALKGGSKMIGSKFVSGTIHLIATHVLAVIVLNSRLIYVGREWPDDQFRIVSIGEGISRKTPLEENALRAFFGPPSKLSHTEFGLIALEQTEFQWVVMSNQGQKVLVKPDGARVFGVLVDERDEPGLVALEDDLQTVSLCGRNWRKVIFRTHAPVEHIALNHRAPEIAYSTAGGEIVIYSIQHKADLCRHLTEPHK